MGTRLFVLCALGASLLFVGACTPAVRSTPFANYPPHPSEHPIRIYRVQAPECPFEEVGIVSSRQRNKFISMEEVLSALMERAREMGGDAIVGFGEDDQARGAVVTGGNVVVDRDPTLSGTVIRFTDLDCRQ